ncbi:hypothetical protein BpHYR1_019362 [Brachionus plicatilis]|uniref:Uncharacterized protein n=1 Tax=Brachionus plicatilis TaxID=10195 RepID=A0A3M7PNF0_BRAPC|nr:hypothetical protein BpHYR1_019362 [Brachionus plicatilis]
MELISESLQRLFGMRIPIIPASSAYIVRFFSICGVVSSKRSQNIKAENFMNKVLLRCSSVSVSVTLEKFKCSSVSESFTLENTLGASLSPRMLFAIRDNSGLSEKHEFFAVPGSYCCGQMFLLPFQLIFWI